MKKRYCFPGSRLSHISFLPVVLLSLFLPGCTNESRTAAVIHPAFYHWQTRLNLTSGECAFLDSLGVQTLYVKAFDVDWDDASGSPVPLAVLETGSVCPGIRRIVPTVFITNRTIEQLPEDGLQTLARRVHDKLDELFSGQEDRRAKEVQFDCDWTEGTRDAFFRFLDLYRDLCEDNGYRITATIRLHQVKFFERTGVPPVDAGMLMCYNTGEVDEWETENSILDAGLVDRYLAPETTAAYPLPLDIALPVFRWGVVFRDGSLVYLLHGLEAAGLRDTSRFVKTDLRRYEVRKSTYLQGYYLYEGDRIRVENTDPVLLEEVAGRLTAVPSARERTVVFYHLDTTTLKSFRYEDLEKILALFR